MDITQFFDRVNHDILLTRIAHTIRDKRVLRLIGRYLRAGVMINGVVQVSEEGTPQGGPLSPLLANIYLEALDQELERRGLKFSRYADDCNVYVSSSAAAERVLASLTEWIRQHLRLEVHGSKSGTGRAWERKFLGFQITSHGGIGIAPRSVEKFRQQVRHLWRRGQSLSSNQLRDQWQRYVQGWWGYYRLVTDPKPIFKLEGWIRRHIRCCFWQRWHDWRGRKRHLRALGIRGRDLRIAHTSVGAWAVAKSATLQHALNNALLRRLNFILPSNLGATV
jgi:group II intron reverse transcriptase/maturase